MICVYLGGKNTEELVKRYWSLLINLINAVIPYCSFYKNEYKPIHVLNICFSWVSVQISIT